MPDAVITSDGAYHFLARILNADWRDPSFLMIISPFVNNRVPGESDTLADYDRSGFGGPIAELNDDKWNIPTLSGGRWRSVYNDTLAFQAAPLTVTVYGYFVYQYGGNRVYWAQRFDAPVVVVSGQVIRILPHFDFRQCT